MTANFVAKKKRRSASTKPRRAKPRSASSVNLTNIRPSHSSHREPAPVGQASKYIQLAIDYVNSVEAELIAPIQAVLDDHPGRRSSLRWKHVLLGITLAQIHQDLAELRRAWAHLWHLDETTGAQIGLKRCSYQIFRTQFHRGLAAIDQVFPIDLELATPTANPKRNTTMDHDSVSGSSVSDGPRVYLETFVSMAIRATRTSGYEPTKIQSLDGTYLRTWARDEVTTGRDGDRVVLRACADPDARVTKAPANWEEDYFNGFELHLMVDARPNGAPMGPNLISSCGLAPAGAHRGQTSLPMLAAAVKDFDIKEVCVDRGYSGLGHIAWGEPIHKLGLLQHVDLKDTQHTISEYMGAVIVDNWPHSPSMPKDLRVEAHFSTGMSATERARIEQIHRAREPYRFTLHGYDRNGNPRFKAPCHNGTLSCAVKRKQEGIKHPVARSGALAVDGPITAPVVVRTRSTEPTRSPTCCTGVTITIPLEKFRGAFQKYPYGSPEWQRHYGQRNQVESVNSVLQTWATNISERRFVKVLSGRARALFVGFACIAHNLRTIAEWDDAYAKVGTTRAQVVATQTAKASKRKQL